ncbi:hypothetical protein GQ53DRAFT_822512 [Thozetella sp. PMI_491]|nr:hypothetical protein GQ53DRAFT_822512 [Thozetella sp. PMI_491]
MASFEILTISNGQDVGTWANGIQPNTFLSITAVVSNILLTFAFTQGLAISYWRRCLKGTLLADIHHHWNAGYSFLGACRGILRGNALLNGIAFLAWTISVVRSPMNQAAAGVTGNTPATTSGAFKLRVPQQLPQRYTGISQASRAELQQTAALTPSFADILRGYSTRTTMNLTHDDCGDTCESTVKVFGFCAKCTMNSQSINFEATTGLEDDSALFQTQVELWVQAQDSIASSSFSGLLVTSIFLTGQTPGESANSTQVNRTCHLQPSIMSVPILLTNASTVTLQGSWDTDTCVQSLNYLTPANTGGLTTIGGFQLGANSLFASQASF